MDIKFALPAGVFNFRTAALIFRGDSLLAVQDPNVHFWYLPGGHVEMGERAEDAVLREVCEELHAQARIVRPLFFNQNFFHESVQNLDFHEVNLVFQLASDDPALLHSPETFHFIEDGGTLHTARWIPLSEIADTDLRPAFLKDRIFSLPEHMEMI